MLLIIVIKSTNNTLFVLGPMSVFNLNFVYRKKNFVKVLQEVFLVRQASVNKRLAAHLGYCLF